MHVAVIGCGYVGLVSGTCFSEFGFEVTCVDRDEDKVRRLLAGDVPIFEPGLDHLVATNRASGRLQFTNHFASAVKAADIVFIAVGTESRGSDGSADMLFVEQAAKDIALNLDGFTVIVTKSTVPVGTAKRLADIVREANPSADFAMASNPEFLREGSAIEDFMRPDRVIIGVEDERAKESLRKLYRPLFLRDTPMLFTSLETAELTKYAANAFLATKITFINQIADLCEELGANVQDVANGLGLDSRIGPKFLHPGPGYGGSCFPKDTRALSVIARDAGKPITIVDAVIDANSRRKEGVAGRIISALGGSAEGKKIGVLGVSFKPNTDDMREAPSLVFIPALIAAGATISAYDPAAMDVAAPLLPDVAWCKAPYDTMTDADAIVIATEWNAFRALDLNRMAALMKQPVLIDLRNIYTVEEMSGSPFAYHSIGRPQS
jgi:UDPglucose 6-dehydrogenase